MKKYLLILVTLLVFASLVTAADTTCCPDCNTNVKVTANMYVKENSNSEHSKILIYGTVKNLECNIARNTRLTLEYTPNDYTVGPEITIWPSNQLFLGPIFPHGERPYFFILNVKHFYPFGPLSQGQQAEITFDVKATGSNFPTVYSNKMLFFPIDEEIPMGIETLTEPVTKENTKHEIVTETSKENVETKQELVSERPIKETPVEEQAVIL